MILTRYCIASLLLFAAQALAPTQSHAAAAETPEEALRSFMYALYANDAEAYERAILPTPGSADLIGPQSFTPEQLTKLRSDIAGLSLRQTSPITHRGDTVTAGTPPPVGSTTFFMTQFRGVTLAIPMVQTDLGWKADVRFWLEMRRMRTTRPERSDPAIVAKVFLLAILAKKPEELNALSATPIKAEEYTSANNLPPGDLDQILSLCIEMPVVQARPGEVLRLPSGDIVVGDSRPDILALVGLMGPTEVPFALKKVEGAWRVLPQRYFEMLRSAGAV